MRTSMLRNPQTAAVPSGLGLPGVGQNRVSICVPVQDHLRCRNQEHNDKMSRILFGVQRVCLQPSWPFELWFHVTLLVHHLHTHDVVLWLCSGFYFKYTVWKQHTHKHMSRRHFEPSPYVSSVKAALTPDQECGGLECVPILHVLVFGKFRPSVCVCASVSVCACVCDAQRICSDNVSSMTRCVCNYRKLAIPLEKHTIPICNRKMCISK